MEITKKLIDHINNTELLQLQKNVLIGLIKQAEERQEKLRADRELIAKIANEKKLSEILLSNDEVKIYSVYGKDEWDVKYPVRSIFLNKKGVWERSGTVSPNFDVAFLIYLENKHLGANSKFVDFALKMLEIKLPE